MSRFCWKGALISLGEILPEVARLLLEHGAEVGCVGKDRKTALRIAERVGGSEVIQVLKEEEKTTRVE